MAPLFKSKQKERLVAVFDIGSGSVGGALVKIPAEDLKNPIIVFSTRNEIVFHKELDFNTLLDDTNEALNKTAEELYQSNSGAPDEIFCVLSSPWYVSESRMIKIEKSVPFVLHKHYADELVKKEIDSLLVFYNKKFSKSNSEPELIEYQVLSVFLNGYQVDDPINKKAKRVEMNIMASLSPKICISKIKETLLKTFHRRKVTFSSFTNLAFIGIQKKYINLNSYVLVDIGGEITDVNVISNGVLSHTISFPFGRRTFFRFLSNKLGKDISEIRPLFAMYMSDVLEKEEKEKMRLVLDSITQTWGEAFLESVKSLPQKTSTLPSTLFLITSVDILKWFSDSICNEEYINSVMTQKKCNVIGLETTSFNDICDLESSSCDPFLMIEAIAILRKQKHKENRKSP